MSENGVGDKRGGSRRDRRGKDLKKVRKQKRTTGDASGTVDDLEKEGASRSSGPTPCRWASQTLPEGSAPTRTK